LKCSKEVPFYLCLKKHVPYLNLLIYRAEIKYRYPYMEFSRMNEIPEPDILTVVAAPVFLKASFSHNYKPLVLIYRAAAYQDQRLFLRQSYGASESESDEDEEDDDQRSFIVKRGIAFQTKPRLAYDNRLPITDKPPYEPSEDDISSVCPSEIDRDAQERLEDSK